MRYDLAILGNDEAAFETAAVANERGLKTLVVVSDSVVSSWLETNALQNLAKELMATRESEVCAARQPAFCCEVQSFVRTELQDFSSSLRSKGIDVLNAQAEFDGLEQLTLRFPDFSRPVRIRAPHIVIATGVVRTAFPTVVGMERRHAADSILNCEHLPASVRVIGGNDYGAALAACLQIAGTKTQLVTRTHCDSASLELAASSGVDIADHPDDFPIAAGDFDVQRTIDCRGRIGQTQELNLSSIKVEADEHGQLWCGRHFETWCRGVYGVGEVVGFSPDSTLPAAIQADSVVNRICDSGKKSRSLTMSGE